MCSFFSKIGRFNALKQKITDGNTSHDFILLSREVQNHLCDSSFQVFSNVLLTCATCRVFLQCLLWPELFVSYQSFDLVNIKDYRPVWTFLVFHINSPTSELSETPTNKIHTPDSISVNFTYVFSIFVHCIFFLCRNKNA